MKDFNDLYKSYLKSIIKEDHDEDIAEDATEVSENSGPMTLEELNAKYAGRKIIYKSLVWHETADGNELPEFVTEEQTIDKIVESDKKPGKYSIVFSKIPFENSIYNYFDKTLDEIEKKFNVWSISDGKIVVKFPFDDAWGDEARRYEFKLGRRKIDDGWCFAENVPDDEKYIAAFKDFILKKKAELLEKAQNYGSAQGI